MSGTLDTSSLLGAISKDVEVNLPPDALEYSKERAFDVEPKALRASKVRKETRESSSRAKELEEVRTEVQRLKQENEELQKKGSSRLGRKANPEAQEEKVLSAIKSEMIKQDTREPIVQKRLFRKEYKVHPTTLNATIERLVEKGLIKETVVSYAGKIKTFKYLII